MIDWGYYVRLAVASYWWVPLGVVLVMLVLLWAIP